jgi:TatD DNase family protein
MTERKVFPYLVDSHAHLDFKQFDRDREQVLHRARDIGVKLILNIGFDLQSSRESVKLAEKYSFIYAVVGIHPHDAAKVPADYLLELEKLTRHPRVVALGEMGLDFYRDRSPRTVQRKVFREQLRLAKRVNLPVVIHDRDAHQEIMEIMEEEGLPEKGGVMHCFSGDLGLARQALKMGLYISIAGPVTYSRNERLCQVAAWVPANKLLVETDSPFLTPVPLRGKRNEPCNVAFTAEKIAELRGVPPEEIGRLCLENTKNLFSIT